MADRLLILRSVVGRIGLRKRRPEAASSVLSFPPGTKERNGRRRMTKAERNEEELVLTQVSEEWRGKSFADLGEPGSRRR